MDQEQALQHAVDWISSWNNRDLEAVLRHYADDVVFRSPKVEAILGKPAVRGKRELREYWTQALQRNPVLRFRLDRALWSAEENELVVFFSSRSAAGTVRACETMRFNDRGEVIEGAAYYSSRSDDPRDEGP